MKSESICFDILGMNLHLLCSTEVLGARMLEVFSEFPQTEKSEPLMPCPLTQTPNDDFFARLHHFRQNGKKLLTYEKISMRRLQHISLYEDGHSAVFYDRKKDQLEGFIDDKSFERSSFFAHTFWTFILWEVLANRDLFLLHASALVDRNGKNYLFAANSRQGKSTISISLARAGYALLSDDLVCLATDGSIRALPRNLHLDPVLGKRFSELSFLSERPNYFPLNPKRNVSRQEIAQLYQSKGCKILDKVEHIDMLLFPSICPIAESHMQALGKGEALARLIPPSALLFVEEEATKTHMRCLKNLVEHASCYDLKLGKDLYDRPDEIPSLLERSF